MCDCKQFHICNVGRFGRAEKYVLLFVVFFEFYMPQLWALLRALKFVRTVWEDYINLNSFF